MKSERKIMIPVFFVVMGCVFMTCDKTDKMIQEANDNIEVTNLELYEGNRKYVEEVEIFRNVTEKKLAANDSTMICFKTDLANENKSGNSYYQNLIHKLERQNLDLKTRIDNYQPVDEAGWKNFQQAFNSDLRELEEAYKNLGVRSTKQLVRS